MCCTVAAPAGYGRRAGWTVSAGSRPRSPVAFALVVMMSATSRFAQAPPPPRHLRRRVADADHRRRPITTSRPAMRAQSRLELPGTPRQPGLRRRQPRFRTNPGGGGASASTEDPRYRTWYEGYGISVRTDPQGDFVGDKRKTFGGVAGFGARVAPGVNLGFSVDQSHTDIDVPLALQSATLDLTQIGFNGSVDKGPWTWAFAVVHGFGKVHSSRDTGFGLATRGLSRRGRRRTDRDQLLLDQGPDAHRAQGRARICAGHRRGVPGGGRT